MLFRSAIEIGIHWDSKVHSREVFCIAKPSADENDSADSIESFVGRKHVLKCRGIEHVIIQNGNVSARLAVVGGSLLKHNCALIYQIEGLARLHPVSETLTNLRRLKSEFQLAETSFGQPELRLRDCLVALDGHLAGRSYHDIAVVLYGADRVKGAWSNETRDMKDKVRRAVAAGIGYMSGGY